MNAKQARFVAEYLKDSNATQAAIRAGYSPDSAHVAGCRLLKNDKIAAAVAKGNTRVVERAAAAAGLSKAWVMEKLMAVHDSAMGDNPVVDRYGNPTGTTQKNYAGANKALELIGKELGMFADVKINTSPDAWAEIQGYLKDNGRTAESVPGSVH